MKLQEIAKLTVVEPKNNARAYFAYPCHRLPRWTSLQYMLIELIPLANQTQILDGMRRVSSR